MAHCNTSLSEYGLIWPRDRRDYAGTYVSLPGPEAAPTPQVACTTVHSFTNPRVDFAVDLNVRCGAKDHRRRSKTC